MDLIILLVSLALSLPQHATALGEGSSQFTGLNSAPEANLATGSSSYTVPILIPPGHEGATPGLALAYMSGGGDGPFGRGWSMGIGEIVRGARHGVPRCVGDHTTNDFVLTMPGVMADLVYNSADQKFYAKYDEGYIVATPNVGANAWTVTDRAGNTYSFGLTANARSWTGSDTFMNNATCAFTARWALEKITTPRGASVDITYARFDNTPILSSVEYGGFPDLLGADAIPHAYRVEFTSSNRTYPKDVYNLGVKETYSKLITNIAIKYRPTKADVSFTTIRQYALVISETPFGGEATLQSISTAGMPTKTFTYASNDVEVVNVLATAPLGNALLDASIDTSFTYQETHSGYTNSVVTDSLEDLVDMTGDGIPDRVSVEDPTPANTWIVSRGTGTSYTAATIPWDTSQIAGLTGQAETLARSFTTGSMDAGSGNNTTFTEFAMVDITGDGFPDFIDARPQSANPDAATSWRVYPGNCTSSGCRFLPALATGWSAPRSYLARTKRQKSQSAGKYFDIDYMMLIDMNADGYVDFLETPVPPGAEAWPGGYGPAPEPSGNWVVYYGSPTGFGSAQPLAMTGYLAIRHGLIQSGSSTYTLRSLFDFNADGLPDRISSDVWFDGRSYAQMGVIDSTTYAELPTGCTSTPSACSSAWFLDVELNTGSSFSQRVRSLLSAGLNNGASNVSYIGWDESVPAPNAPNFSYGQTRQSIFDVNGDGLPDWVGAWSYGQGTFVLYNVGSGRLEGGASAFQTWTQYPSNGMIIPKRSLGGLPYPLRRTQVTSFPLDPRSTPFFTVSRSDGVKEVKDLNGDGMQEVIQGLAPGNAWFIQNFQSTNEFKYRFGLLAKVDEGNGAVSEMRYAPSSKFDHTGGDGVADLPFASWVLTATRRTDGLCAPQPNEDRFEFGNTCIPNGHEIVRKYEYSGGFFNTAERMFMGFKTARQIDTDGNVVETTSHVTPGLVGKTSRIDVFAGSLRLRRTNSNWVVGAATNGNRHQVYLANTSTVEFTQPANTAGSSDLCSITLNDPPDGYGRVGRTCVTQCVVDGSGNISGTYSCDNPTNNVTETVITQWADPTIQSLPVRERPSQIEVWGYRNSAPELISRTRFEYDGQPYPGQPLPIGQVGKGLVTRVSSYLDETNSNFATGWIVTERRGYDAYGNTISIQNAHGKTQSIGFDQNLFALYKTSSTYTNDSQVTFTTSYVTDLRFGKISSTTDPNNDTAQVLYDALGRPVCEAQPGDTLAGCQTVGSTSATVTRDFLYATPGSTNFELQHNRLVQRVVEPNNPSEGYLEAVTYFDGLGRGRFKKVRRVIGNTSNSTLQYVIEGQTEFDSEGRPVRVFAPYQAAQANSNPGDPNGANLPATTSVYGPLNGISGGPMDPLGRPRLVDPPGPTFESYYYEGNRKRSVDSIGGELQEYRDSKQRVTSTVRLYGTGVISSVAVSYDAAGRIVGRILGTDPATYSYQDYDSMGRRIRSSDPDAGGLWTYGYDYLGNLIYSNDPKIGQHSQTAFDDQSRPVLVCTYGTDAFVADSTTASCGTGGSLETVFGYDTGGGATANQKGRLSAATDYAGSSSYYSTKSISYDDLGRVSNETYSIDGRIEWFNYAYDRAGHVLSIGISLGGSAVYGYNAAGQPVTLVERTSNGSVQSNHVTDIDYDVFGRLQKVAYANGVTETKNFYPASQGFSLSSIVTQGGTGTHLNLGYEYNALGKIYRITDGRNASGPLMRSATYDYDGGGRLRTVSGSNVNDTFEFDAIGNLKVKSGQALDYNPSVGTAGPHHVDTIGSLAVTYDANGNRATRALANGGVQTYGYDRLDRLRQIGITGPGAQTVTFKYGADGRKVIKQVGSNPATRYYGNFFERSFEPIAGGGYNEIQTKHFYIAGMRVSSTTQNFGYSTGEAFPAAPIYVPRNVVFWLTVVTLSLILVGSTSRGIRVPVHLPGRLARVGGSILLVFFIQVPAAVLLPSDAIAGGGGAPPTSSVYFYHGDHLGSTHAVTDSTGALTTQIRYDVYGKEILRTDGSGNSLTPSERVKRGFTGHEREHVSGLIDAGARFLDSEIGQFLTADPAGQFGSPYAYGPWDPVNNMDPSGASSKSLFRAFFHKIGALFSGDKSTWQEYGAAALEAVGIGLTIIAIAAVGPAAAGPGLLTIEGLSAVAGASIGTYSTVQQFRHEEVPIGVTIAGMALSLFALAYAEAESTAANGDLTKGRARTLGTATDEESTGHARVQYVDPEMDQRVDEIVIEVPVGKHRIVGVQVEKFSNSDPIAINISVESGQANFYANIYATDAGGNLVGPAVTFGSPVPEVWEGFNPRIGVPKNVTPGRPLFGSLAKGSRSTIDGVVNNHGPSTLKLSFKPSKEL